MIATAVTTTLATLSAAACGGARPADPAQPEAKVSSVPVGSVDAGPIETGPSEPAPSGAAHDDAGDAARTGDPEAAVAAAKKRGRATLLVFCASWAVACGELASSVADTRVQEILRERFVVARVDATDDDDPKTRARLDRYGVTGLPLFIVIDRRGKEAGRALGLLDASGLARLLERAK